MGTLFDWSTTAASNTACDGLSTATGMPIANVDNVLRSMMALVRNSFASALQSFLAGTSALGVANGGTGAATLTGVLKGNGTGAVTAIATGGTTTKFLRDDGTFAAPLVPVQVKVTDDSTALAAGTGKAIFRMATGFTLTAVRASLATAQTAGTLVTIDINEAGASILSTKLTLDNGERTSVTATTAPVLSDTALADDAEITIDIDAIGDGTAKGLTVTLIGYQA